MIKLENNQKLYYIENQGCDDTTYGLVALTDEEFAKFKVFIENLNKNSTYCCQPVIEVCIIDPENLREATEDDIHELCPYFGDKAYRLKDLMSRGEMVSVIKGR